MVRGPTDVRNRELVFLQFSRNETEEDFSAISYMIFSKFSDMVKRYFRGLMLMFSMSQIHLLVCIKCCSLTSSDKAAFMMECERNYSMWTFSGGFRTWVKMSLVKTTGRGNESVEFRQEVMCY